MLDGKTVSVAVMNSVGEPPIWWNWKRSPAQGLVIGVITPSYGLEKVSYLIEPSGYEYIKLSKIPTHRLFKGSRPITECPVIVGPSVDLIHTFNNIPLNRDFIVSFEAELPRFLGGPTDRQLQFGYRLLSSPRCKGIYSLSEAGKAFATKRMRAFGHHELADRVGVFRGAIAEPDWIITAASKAMELPVKACFVGGDAFRKGIEATIMAIEELRKQGLHMELTVVGRCEAASSVAPGKVFDTHWLRRKVSETGWITHHEYLPNARVIKLFQESHVHFFPSLQESLGWVLVESGMCRTARIATDIFAFPELIESGVDGWTVGIPKNDDNWWLHLGTSEAKEQWDDTQRQIAASIVRIFTEGSVGIADLIGMGESAHKRMYDMYGISVARTRLEEIYADALGSVENRECLKA